MEMPSIPTDNLCKFLSIAGLVLFGAVTYIEWTMTVEIGESLLNLEEESAILDKELYYLEKDIDAIIDRLENDEKAENLSIEDKTEIIAFHNTKQDKLRKLAIKKVKIRMSAKKIDYLITQRDAISSRSNVIQIIGLIIAIIGFSFWYYKVQRPTDQFLSKGQNDR